MNGCASIACLSIAQTCLWTWGNTLLSLNIFAETHATCPVIHKEYNGSYPTNQCRFSSLLHEDGFNYFTPNINKFSDAFHRKQKYSPEFVEVRMDSSLTTQFRTTNICCLSDLAASINTKTHNQHSINDSSARPAFIILRGQWLHDSAASMGFMFNKSDLFYV